MFHYYEKIYIYFANLNEKGITENKNFWQTIKPFLSEKTKLREKKTLIENKNLVSDDAEVANYLSTIHICTKIQIVIRPLKQFLSMKTIQVLLPSGVFVIKFQTLIFLTSIKIPF